jgi:ribosomal protein S18 acetylase RimI-like enzyme
MAAIRVRRARRKDAEAIARLTDVLGRWIMKKETRTTADDIRRFAFGPDRWCDILVAYDGDAVLGYALYRPFFEGFTGRRRMFLSDLAIAPDRKRSGIGELLMRALAREALKLECDVITWECSDDNPGALAFYAKHKADRIDAVVTLALERPYMEALAKSD